MIRMFSTHGQRYPSTIPHRRWPWRLLALAVLGLACAPLHAACTVSADGMIFGNYNDDSGVDSTGTITVTGCSASTSYTITLSAGSSGDFSTRTMHADNDSSHTLNYNLYIDPTHLSIWGDGKDGSTSTVSDTGTGGSYTVYGRIPAEQNPYVGSYHDDAVIITLQF